MPQKPINVAVLQMTSGLDVAANAATLARAIDEAAGNGAHILSTPEMTNFLAKSKSQSFERAVAQEEDIVLKAARQGAKLHAIWVHLGSLCIRLDDTQLANRSYIINPDGEITARYDKLHMFDVDLGNGERYMESALYREGDHAVIAGLCGAVCGMSICYDLRFAALYTQLAQAGAQIMLIPAAFTQPTGQAHWETLLKARAIENTSYVIAAGQTGNHESGRKTHGHSMVIDPWGRVLSRLEREPGLLYASLDMAVLASTRQKMPSLSHSRSFNLYKNKG